MSDHADLPEELGDVASRLEAERPVPTGSELDRVWRRATAGGAGSKRAQTTRIGGSTRMKPRLAIVAMIALGALLSFSGSGLAISGISGSGDVSVAQYEPDVLPDVDEGDVEEVGVVGVAEEPADVDAVQPTRQVVAAEDGALPFTGLAAIPLIGIGVGLMAGGLALHRRTRQSQGQ